MPITSKHFGTLPTGDDVTLYTLSSEDGSAVDIMTYGGVREGLREEEDKINRITYNNKI